jgi:hypothetical protein
VAWRRRKLQSQLRVKLAALEKEARHLGFKGKPDVVAHSFGTWLIGHLLEDMSAGVKIDHIAPR